MDRYRLGGLSWLVRPNSPAPSSSGVTFGPATATKWRPGRAGAESGPFGFMWIFYRRFQSHEQARRHAFWTDCARIDLRISAEGGYLPQIGASALPGSARSMPVLLPASRPGRPGVVAADSSRRDTAVDQDLVNGLETPRAAVFCRVYWPRPLVEVELLAS